MPLPPDRPVIFFDGVCNLCNRTVQWVLRHDRKGQFLFAALQSDAGTEAKAAAGGVESVVLWWDGGYHTASDAALGIGRLLGGPWRFFATLGSAIPKGLRDRVYRWIACNRYRWFGRRDACMMPAPELRARFL